MAAPSLATANIAAPQQMTPGKIITVPGIPGHFIQVEADNISVGIRLVTVDVCRRDPTV